MEGDGAFSFHIPLPNPKGPIRAFLDRVREVLSSPLPPHYAPHLNALVPGAALARLSSQGNRMIRCLQCLCRTAHPCSESDCLWAPCCGQAISLPLSAKWSRSWQCKL